jgi:hypothetical protein
MDSNQTETDFFHRALEKDSYYFWTLACSTIAWTTSIPLLFSIIWYERGGFEKHQIFTNKLVSSICWTAIELFLLIHTTLFARFTFGPLPRWICFWQLVFRRAILKQFVLLLDAIMLARFAFIFWLKNPAAFPDTFWIFFINTWVIGVAMLDQFAFGMVQGEQALEFFFCTGTDPTLAFHLPKTFNGYLEVASLIALPMLQFKIYRFKHLRKSGPQTHRQVDQI